MIVKVFCLFCLFFFSQFIYSQNGICINHRSTDISQIPDQYIAAAKSNLKIGYFRRSHGSQVDLGGMAALRRYSSEYATKYDFNKTGSGGALFLSTQTSAEWNSLDFENTTWVQITRSFLDNPANAQINVIMWAWSSNFFQCSAQQYVDDMEMLIGEYGSGGTKGRAVPVHFVFQTACGQRSPERNILVFEGNKLIRAHCKNFNRVLFDFNDLESYDPSGKYFGDGDANGNYTNIRRLNDDLAYTSSSSGGSVYSDCRNWGIDWMNTNPATELTKLSANNICTVCAHSEGAAEGEVKDNSRLHCVLKGRAAWALWATLAGWNNSTPSENLFPVAIANGPYSGSTDANINFSSIDSNDPDGTIASYLWDFGDNETSILANPSHSFTASGTYVIELTITDNKGAKTTVCTSAIISSGVTKNNLPICKANGPYSGIIGVAVTFSSVGTQDTDGAIVSGLWKFGDGSTIANVTSPSHVYSTMGTYKVVLSVTDNKGASSTDTAIVTISSANVAPIAKINGPYSAFENVSITFSSAGSSDSDGTIRGCLWNFGDGYTSTLENPAHSYATSGIYNVSLIVTDDDGATNRATTTSTITVNSVNQGTLLIGSYFETGWDGWSDGGIDADRYSGPFSYEGSYSINLQDNSGAASTTISPIRDIRAYDQVTIDFNFYANSMEAGEDFFVGYYDGTTWRNVATFTSGMNFTNGSFIHKTVTIARTNYTFPVNARFAFQCDASENDDDIYIDAVVIKGYSISAKSTKSSQDKVEKVSIAAIEEQLTEDLFLFPNPAGNLLNVKLKVDDNTTAEIYTISGKLVMTEKLSEDNTDIDLSNIKSGVYILKATKNNKAIFKRFIKE